MTNNNVTRHEAYAGDILKIIKNGSLCSPHTEISLSSPEEHDVGAKCKTQIGYKFRQHIAYK